MTDDSSPARPGRRLSPYIAVGAQVGAYRIEAFLDRGGMASIYEATDLRLNRTVALKVLGHEVSDNTDFRERFMRESRFAASLDHPNIVPIYEAGEDEGLLYIAMRFVRGSNLAGLLKKSGSLDPTRALDILAPVADALDTAHSAGLVHRDVKPANILLTVAPRTRKARARLPHRFRFDQANLRADEAHRDRQFYRHDGLHLARTDSRRTAGRANRHVCPRLCRLRMPDRSPALRAGRPGRAVVGASHRAAPVGVNTQTRPGGRRLGHCQSALEGSRGPLREL